MFRMLRPSIRAVFAMTIAALEAISHPAGHDGLPARIEQRTCDFMTLVQLTLLFGLLLLLSWPYAAVAVAAAADPAVLADITAQPRALSLVLAGWCLGVLLLGIPALRCLQRLARRRHITLTQAYVEVAERSLWGSRTWGCPLNDFTGLTHRVRTRASGRFHEVILVHRDPRRTLLLRAGESLSLAATHRLANQLGVPVIPVSMIHSGHRADTSQAGERRPVPQCIDTAEGMGCP